MFCVFLLALNRSVFFFSYALKKNNSILKNEDLQRDKVLSQQYARYVVVLALSSKIAFLLNFFIHNELRALVAG